MTLHDLVEEHADFVFRSLRRAGLDSMTADDATQQVYLIVGRRLASVEHGKEKAFLYGTAMNVAAQHKRRAARLSEIVFEEEEPMGSGILSIEEPPSLDELLDQRRARGLLDDVLAAMPDKLREVFVLCEIEEMTSPEVATCLEVPVGTVSSRLLRARKVFDQTLTRLQARRSFRRNTP